MIAMSVGSYATAIAIGAAGAHHRFRVRVAIAAAAAVVISTVFMATAHLFFGMFAGQILSTWALSLLYCAAILFLGVGLHPILGRFSSLTYASMFVGLNFTTAGGAFNPEVQYPFFGFLHNFWIGAGFIESTRNIAYFPHLSIAPYVAILIGWLIVGLICLVLGVQVEKRRYARRHAHPERPHKPRPYSERVKQELQENVAPV
ncbi:hypothetical protein [Corynebacterium liangguodongii]|nr:hypothetical protein [Corynebacterium liangguodongii]